jgi:hypothetical protein
MNTELPQNAIHGGATVLSAPQIKHPHGVYSPARATETVAAALSRLAMAAKRGRRRKGIFNDTPYYGVGAGAHLEETIDDVLSPHVLDAVITRNHYGSLVINAQRALFIDVDVASPSRPVRWMNALVGRRSRHWQTMLEDLCTVLASETDEGFRVYRTAAGFRILATTHEFQPRAQPANRLMRAVGADGAFMKLCRIQNLFRARLTPKPWRCGAKLPPNSFPRQSVAEERQFADWLSRYENACRDRATCRYLEHVGCKDIHERIAPIIELHDRETKAFQSLPLA